MVHMATLNHPNNVRLRALIASAGLTQAEALTLFNRGQAKAITVSGFKAWLAAPESVRWRLMADNYLEHAERVLGRRASREDRTK